MTAIWILLAAPVFCAQSSAPAPAFEVASIKLHQLPPGIMGVQIGGPSALRISGNRLSTFGSLPMLVMAAYNLRLHEVSGGPEWTDGNSNPLVFDIQAKAEGDGVLAPESARQMLQTLLASRFHLELHVETREMPVYEIAVDKNGPKLKEAPPGAENTASTKFAKGIWIIRYPSISMSALALNLASNFDRPLLDKTGLGGTYDVTLEYRRPGVLSSAGEPGQPVNAETEPSIFTALQQLGLRVVRAKGPVEITVIDRAEKPSEN